MSATCSQQKKMIHSAWKHGQALPQVPKGKSILILDFENSLDNTLNEKGKSSQLGEFLT